MKLTPKHKAIEEYYRKREAIAAQGATHELAVREAFKGLLDTVGALNKWTLVVEERVAGVKKVVRPDGTLKDEYRLAHGYWEAKDSKDDLYAEINKKFERGYPKSNIIFEDTRLAVLYQNGRHVGEYHLSSPGDVADLLNQFLAYSEPTIEEFHAAVEKFKTDTKRHAESLADLIREAHRTNKTFEAAFNEFYELCKTALNPNISRDAVDEMLIQHLLTERLMRTVLDNPDFARRNVIAVEVEKVIDALTSKSFSRAGFLGKLDYFYKAIEGAAQTWTDFGEKQHFINTVYERFFQGYAVKVADTHGIVYTPQPIVDFMCAAVEEVLRDEFQLSLADDDVCIIDPATGTGNFIINLLHRIHQAAPHRLAEVYQKRLFANEVMLLPYYVASLNIEHAYFELTGQYAPFEGLCFVDTLDLAEGSQMALSFITQKNSERVERQKIAPITVIIGNPPYNIGQVNENDNNKNRKYEVIDGRISTTYAKDSKASNKNALSDVYVKFFRWAADRLQGRDGIVCYVSNNSFVDQIAFDGMRKHLLQDFTRVYHLDLHGNVRQNPKLSGTTHNVFGIQVGVGITVAVRSAQHDERRLFYHRVPEFWRKEEKLGFLNACLTPSPSPFPASEAGEQSQYPSPFPASDAGGQTPSPNPFPASGDGEQRQGVRSVFADEQDEVDYGESVPSSLAGRVRVGLPLPDDAGETARVGLPMTDNAGGHGLEKTAETADINWHSKTELWEKLKPLAREMRKEPTVAEKALWQRLNHKQVGVKFRRQHAFDRFIVDFYAHDPQIVIEVDGPTHDYTEAEDAVRQAFLESLGLRVLRFTNQQVLSNMEGVLAAIVEALENPQVAYRWRDEGNAEDNPTPALPASGEGVGTARRTPLGHFGGGEKLDGTDFVPPTRAQENPVDAAFLPPHRLRGGGQGVGLKALHWQHLIPDTRYTWRIPDNADEFAAFVPMGSKEMKAADIQNVEAIFKYYSPCFQTNRDDWVYDFDYQNLIDKVSRMIEVYNSEVDRWRRLGRPTNIDNFVISDVSKIKWSSRLKETLQREAYAEFSEEKVRLALYRPFAKQKVFFDEILNHRRGLFPHMLPTPESESENQLISFSGPGHDFFTCLISNHIIDVKCPNIGNGANQCFPFYVYDEDGTNRRENITDWALGEFRRQYGDAGIGKWDIFYYVYGLLHHPGYRGRYAENLKRELPRIPLVGVNPDNTNDGPNNGLKPIVPSDQPMDDLPRNPSAISAIFWAFSKAGRQLAALHLNYETVTPYPLEYRWASGKAVSYRVEKMRLNKDKTELKVNESLTLAGIPAAAFEYRLGNRSALDWVIDQYQVKTDARSGITSDPNQYSEDEKYIVELVGRVIAVSVQTVEIVNGLPGLGVGEE